MFGWRLRYLGATNRGIFLKFECMTIKPGYGLNNQRRGIVTT